MTRTVTASASRVQAIGLLILGLTLFPTSILGQEPPAEGGAEVKVEGTAEESGKSSEPSKATAWYFGRVFPVSGPPIERAVILEEAGRIVAVGVEGEVNVPYGAREMDRRADTVWPGFVLAAGNLFSGQERLANGGNNSRGDTSIGDRLDIDAQGLQALARAGFTTFASSFSGGGIAGKGALLRPVVQAKGLVPLSDCLFKADAFLSMGFEAGTSSKESWKKNLEKARKYLTDLAAWKKAGDKSGAKKTEDKPKEPEKKPEGEKPAEPEKPADGKTETKPAEKKDEPKKDEPKAEEVKEPSKDAKIMPLVDVFERRLPGILGIADAAAFLHAESLFKSEESFRPALLELAPSRNDGRDLWRVAATIHKLGLPVIMVPDFTRISLTQSVRLTCRELVDQGIAVALIPEPGDLGALARFRFQLQEMRRFGFPADEILRAVTTTPAEILGIADRVGSLAVGRDANFLIFRGDPWSPTSGLMEVVVDGRSVLSLKEPLP